MENMKYEDQLNLWCEKYLPKSFKQDKKKKSPSAMPEHGFQKELSSNEEDFANIS